MRLKRLQQKLQQANSLRQLNTALKDYLTGLGITTYAFTYYAYHPNSQNKLKYTIASESYDLWHQHYIA